MAREKLGEIADKLSEWEEKIGRIENLSDNFIRARPKITECKGSCMELKESIGALLRDPDVKSAQSSDPDIKKDWQGKSKQFNILTSRQQKAFTKISKLEKEHSAAKKGTPSNQDLEREGTGDDLDSAGNSGGRQVQKQINAKAFQVVNVDMMAVDEQIQAEKAQEIREIEEGVNEVAACYNEFGALVKEQDEDIRIAEDNVVKTRENIQAGTDEIKKAREYQKSSRKWYMCAVCAVVVILGIAILVGVVAS